jgi:hypothetical protein
MLSVFSNRARRDQTQDAIDRLTDEVRTWLCHRRNSDKRGQHGAQLEAVESLVSGGAARLQQAVRLVEVSQPTGDLFEECRLYDLRVLWLRRVWQYFREKFDQRDDPVLKPVLEAADDVVWSCYQQVYRVTEHLAPELTPGPAPLPYIEPWYAPEAFPAELVPAGLKSEVDVGFLREYLNKLPIPVVRLQPACVGAPWWLVYLGHEIGHHVQFGILPKMTLVSQFREAVTEAVLSCEGSDEEAAQWNSWSVEIFADIFGLLLLGSWFLWAMVELELQAADKMLARRSAYPSPVIRLRLLALAAGRLGFSSGEALALRGLVPDRSGAGTEVGRDLMVAERVVDAAFGRIPGLPATLPSLCAFRIEDHRRGGAVDRWRDMFTGGEAVPAERKLPSSRLVTSAAVAAWADIIATDQSDEQRSARRRALAAMTMRAISDNAEPETRAAIEVPTVDGGDLADLLLQASRQELGE